MHCLKYGLTTNNVLGIELVTPQGEIVRLGGKHLDSGHYDLLGLMVGSEGLLGIVTEVTVRILRRPQTARALLIGFDAVEPAGQCVADIIAAGIIPAGMEMMDKPAIHAAEAFVNVGYPLDVEALLIVELDGPEVEVDLLVERVTRIAAANGASRTRASANERERLAFWAGRKAAFPAVGRISPDYYCMDGTIPRRELPRVLAAMAEMSQRFGLRVANVFHAGDGNLHPLILYDANVPGELERAESFGEAILEAVRRRRRRADGRARRRHREARLDDLPIQRRATSRSSIGSSTRSIPRYASTRARYFRRCAAARSSAASTCTPAASALRACRVSRRATGTRWKSGRHLPPPHGPPCVRATRPISPRFSRAIPRRSSRSAPARNAQLGLR